MNMLMHSMWGYQQRKVDRASCLRNLDPVEPGVGTRAKITLHGYEFKSRFSMFIQSNFDGSNIFGTIENCSRHGWFEPLRLI